MKKILFLPNGHGEDQTAAQIIRKLPEGLDISVYPLVGEGAEFKGLNVNMIGPTRSLPGGGFSLRNFITLPVDLAQGLFTLFYSQVRKLKELRGKYDLVIAIGDIVPIVGALLTKTPFIFVGVNKSDYYHTFGFNYTPWEKWLLKKYAKKVYARDEITAKSLKKQGVAAVYAGNPIMDGIGEISNVKYQMSNERAIGFLPGTRKEDLPKNLADLELVAAELKRFDPRFKFFLALRDLELLPQGSLFSVMPFEDVIGMSDVVVGLSGTGNEQAAGIGKPVVAFPGRGAQYNRKFARAQRQLLGEALALTKRDPVKTAEEVWEILNDKARKNYMSVTGKAHMGGPGGIDAIARDILDILK